MFFLSKILQVPSEVHRSDLAKKREKMARLRAADGAWCRTRKEKKMTRLRAAEGGWCRTDQTGGVAPTGHSRKNWSVRHQRFRTAG
jgi:hypothetical protein